MNAPNKTKSADKTAPRAASAKATIWQRLARHGEQGAVESVGLRRFGKRFKGSFHRHVGSRSQEYQKISPRSQWLQPFKRLWKRRDRKATHEHVHHSVNSSSCLYRSARDQRLQPRRQGPLTLGTSLLRKCRVGRSSSRTLPSRPTSTKGCHALHEGQSAPNHAVLKRTDSHDCQGLATASHSTRADLSPLSPDPSTENTGLSLLSNDRIRVGTSTTSSDLAEYERLLEACFKAPARRKPIPGAWRRTPQSAYLSRGPTLPHRNVVTDPMAAFKTNIHSSVHSSAIKPRRAKLLHSEPPSIKVDSPLRAIASRRKSSLLRPACHAVEKSYRRTALRGYPTLPVHWQCARSLRLRPSKTLPNDWPLRNSQGSTSTSTAAETLTPDMESLALHSDDESSVEGSTYQESNMNEEEEKSRQPSMISCGDDDTRPLLSSVDSSSMSDEDVWYDVSEDAGFGETLDRF
ncbi:hypothetical protein DE146DRAFT_510075 [Phaeosphaeria sp. MPI-PUGE-AT-0046c]|nr:hypothetical protein DE146DRAFT_510075 [Phaeosphaeria sp. MPI-PUGE-AT-0046c]